MQNLWKLLENNSYPGRGIVFGCSRDGNYGVMAYFIMGRSENSRNRIFVEHGNRLLTKAFDESKLQDPSLIIYAPVCRLQDSTVVTNGDHTDTIVNALRQGQRFEDALRSRTFEPDAPHFTPRISGLFMHSQSEVSYKMAIIKSHLGNPEATLRQFFEYPQLIAGEGHFLHTYQQDGDPLPTFAGEPTLVAIDCENMDDFGETLWEKLDKQNKISLFVQFVNLKANNCTHHIYNKHLGRVE